MCFAVPLQRALGVPVGLVERSVGGTASRSWVARKALEADAACAAAVCQKVASARAKLLYDIYHMQIMEGDVIRNIRENIQWIAHFHTAGVPGRNDMDDTQELNYRGICAAIAATDYALYVGHEFKPKADFIEALKQAFVICDQG